MSEFLLKSRVKVYLYDQLSPFLRYSFECILASFCSFLWLALGVRDAGSKNVAGSTNSPTLRPAVPPSCVHLDSQKNYGLVVVQCEDISGLLLHLSVDFHGSSRHGNNKFSPGHSLS